MEELLAEIDAAARESGFSGVVRVDARGATPVDVAYGFADRATGRPNATTTRMAMASGSKAFTALTVMRLVERGDLSLDTTARSLLGRDLPMIADDVTVLHLLAHRSGIGDYLDEDAIDDIAASIPPVDVTKLDTIEAFLPWLDGHPTAFAPGERFAYCNGGYMVLALLAERAIGHPFHDLVDALVLAPAAMSATGFFRSDALPPDTALGYLHPPDHPERLHTNIAQLPVRGGGDGGAYTTTADMTTFWQALFSERIVAADTLDAMLTAYTPDADRGFGYGLGFWLPPGPPDHTVELDGSDAGVSFRSVYDRDRDVTWTVMCNWTDGAWPVARRVRSVLAAL